MVVADAPILAFLPIGHELGGGSGPGRIKVADAVLPVVESELAQCLDLEVVGQGLADNFLRKRMRQMPKLRKRTER